MVAEVHGEVTPAGKLVLVDDLRGISQARAISVATVNNMRQNLAFAFLYTRSACLIVSIGRCARSACKLGTASLHEIRQFVAGRQVTCIASHYRMSTSRRGCIAVGSDAGIDSC